MENCFEKVDQILSAACDASLIPGAVFLAGKQGETLFERAYGFASLEPEKIRMTLDTRFDLASLTKVVAVWPCIVKLLEAGSITLEDPLPELLPWDFPNEMQGITLLHLLTHTAGLVEDADLDGFGETREERVKGITRIPLRYPMGQVHYSDLSFILLGEIAAHKIGLPLSMAAAQVWKTLGMTDTCYCPPQGLPFAATEKMNGKVISGSVHDERSQQLFGVAGHAGVFSTARDLGIFCRHLIPGSGGGICGDDWLKKSFRLWAKDPKWDRGLAFVVYREDPEGNLIGHTGFTGTSFKVDTKTGFYAVLLTNRVHPTRENHNLQSIRAEVDALLFP